MNGKSLDDSDAIALQKVIERIMLLLDLGQLNKAWLEVQKLISISHNDASVTAISAGLLVQMGKLDEAESLFINSILPAIPNDPDILSQYADLLIKQRQHKRAQQIIEDAITLEPLEAGHYAILAKALMHQRKLDDGWNQVHSGLALDYTHEGCQEVQAALLLEYKIKGFDVPNWRGVLKDHLANAPSKWRNHFTTGLMHLMEQDYDLAYNHLMETKQLAPNLPIENMLLRLHLRNNRIYRTRHEWLSSSRTPFPSLKLTDNLSEIILLSLGIYLLLSYPLVLHFKVSWWVWPQYISILSVCYCLFTGANLWAVLDATLQPPGSQFISHQKRIKVKCVLITLMLCCIASVWAIQYGINVLQKCNVRISLFPWT